ncbi:hypothetical protein PLEOSDRAFT_1097974 [Pleurotus ostreatus PC15]|uniref:NAD(P)-binding domain-containing protein n=1 Tax=Pleurotus ostreatus (strain PC15) TaxID=1137138 RepID=A0A067NI57_PLEO1|nr:hypothetical protein PLEOSDRAFT_1097974 [Pleurotus ostreatus PC15]
MSSPLVAFIIGAGSNVGSSVAALLKEKGYAVALGSRNPDTQKVKQDGYYPVKIDATEKDSIKAAFAAVNTDLGPPNVVVYNAAFHQSPTDASDPSTLPLDAFDKGASIGSNVFVAIQEALGGFRSSKHESNPKAFIVTGNRLPTVKAPTPGYLALDLQKVIEQRIIGQFARADRIGIQFAFAFLVSESGEAPPYDVFLKSGPTHAKVYWELINRKEGPWDYRFTPDGKKLAGYESL